MSVDADTVRRIAHLARIAVADDEVEQLQGELNAILAFVEQLSEVDVEGVEPMTSVTPMAMKKREDVVTDGGIADDIVQERAGDARIISSSCRRWWNSHVPAPAKKTHLCCAYLDAAEAASARRRSGGGARRCSPHFRAAGCRRSRQQPRAARQQRRPTAETIRLSCDDPTAE